MKTTWVAMVALVLLGYATSGWAHHSFAAEFSADKPVLFKGTVTKMEWVNPHVWIHVQVTKPGGKAEDWAIEGGAPGSLFKRGFSKASLVPGTVIVVDGYAAKDGSRRANGRSVTFEDGKKLFVSSSGAGAPSQ